MITLSEEERKKFAAWLKQEIETDKSLMDRMEKLPIATPTMVKVRKLETTAKIIVARILDNTEAF